MGPRSSLPPTAAWGLALWLAGAAALALLATFAAFFDRFPGDRALADALQDTDVPVLGGFFDFINLLGDAWFYIPLVALLAVACFVRRAWLEAVLVLLVFVPHSLVAALKGWIERPRPAPDLVAVTDRAGGFSFPSGHTVSTAVLFGLLLFLLPALVPRRPLCRLLQAACLVAVVSAGPARVYVGVHWPSDVLGGYLLAALFLAPVIALYRALRPRLAPG